MENPFKRKVKLSTLTNCSNSCCESLSKDYENPITPTKFNINARKSRCINQHYSIIKNPEETIKKIPIKFHSRIFSQKLSLSTRFNRTKDLFRRQSLSKDNDASRELIRNKLKKLNATILNVSLENRKLKLLSKEIMKNNHEKFSSTVHSFYQNVVIADNEKQIGFLNKVINDFKEENCVLLKEITKLRRDNRLLKAIINRYRKEAENKSILESKKTLEYQYMENTTNETVKCDISKDTFSNKLLNFVKRISNVNTIRNLIECIYREFSHLLDSYTVGVFVCDPEICRLFQNENGIIKSVIAKKESADLALSIEGRHVERAEFDPKVTIKAQIKSSRCILTPITGTHSKLNDNMYLIVQLNTNTNPQREQWV